MDSGRRTGPVTILNSTMANNVGRDAGRQHLRGRRRRYTASISLKNTIVGVAAAPTTATARLARKATTWRAPTRAGWPRPGTKSTSIRSLARCKNNGGATWTHALLAGSPAIDAGTNSGCPATDQRGVARPIDGNHDGSAVCDIGAVEAPPKAFVYLPAPTEVVGLTPALSLSPRRSQHPGNGLSDCSVVPGVETGGG